MTIKIRKLNAGDARLIASVLSSSISEIDGKSAREIGVAGVTKLLEGNLEKIWGWLASLAGMTVEEFDNASFSAPIEVITALKEDPDLLSFFDLLQRLLGDLGETQKTGGTE